MDFKEAMKKRHVVRRYRDEELDLENGLSLKKARRRRQREISGARQTGNVKLETEDSSALNLMGKLAFKNAANYFIMSGKESADLNERLGYVGADLMLYAQTLGLNTWWIGGTFSKKTSKEKFPIKKSSESLLSGMGKPLENGTSKRMSKQSVHTRVRHRTGSLPV